MSASLSGNILDVYTANIAHPSHYRVMFGGYRSEQAEHPPRAERQAFQVLLNVIESGQTTGVVRAEETMRLAWVAWSTVHGLAMLLIDGRLPTSEMQDVEALAEFVTCTLIAGLGRSSS